MTSDIGSSTPVDLFIEKQEAFYSRLQKGILLRMEENYFAASDVLDQAIEMEPDNYESYLEKSVCLSLSNRPVCSVRTLREGLMKSKRSYWFSDQERDIERRYFEEIYLGLIDEVNEQAEDSLEHYKNATLIVPDGFYALFSYGYALGSICLDFTITLKAQQKLEYAEESKSYFLKALEIIEKNPFFKKYHNFYLCILYTNIAWILREKEADSLEALEYYTKAATLNNRHVRSLFSRGNLHGKRAEFDNAIADFSKCIEIKESHTPKWTDLSYKVKHYCSISSQSDDNLLFNIFYLFKSNEMTELFMRSYITDFKLPSLNAFQIGEHEKRLSEIYEERGLQYLESDRVMEALIDFTCARMICPVRPYPYIFVFFVSVNIMGERKSFQILRNYMDLIANEKHITNNYFNLNYCDVASIFKHASNALSDGGHTTEANKLKKRYQQLSNHTRVA